MNLQELKEYIPQHQWWSEDCPFRLQYCYWAHSAVEQRLYFHPDYLKAVLLTFKDGFGQEKSSEEEKLEQYYWLQQKYREDRSFVDQERDRWYQVRKELLEHVDIINQESAKWNKRQLLDAYSRLMTIARDSARWGFFIECVDIFNERILPGLVEKELPELGNDERNELILTLATPLIVIFMEEYQKEKDEIIVEHRAEIEAAGSFEELDRQSELRSAVEELYGKYKWISVNYAGSPALTQQDLFEQIQEEAAQYTDEELKGNVTSIEEKIDKIAARQSAYLEQHVLSEALLDDFSIIRELGVWIDERKESMVKTSHAIQVILEQIAQATEVLREQLEMYLNGEVIELLKTGKKVDEELLEKRLTNSVVAFEFDGEDGSIAHVYTDEEADELYKLLNAEELESIKGTVASAPGEQKEYSGTAQVVLDMVKDKFEQGNVLVTSMTRPDFVPLLKKAAAIITDEGGVTCHAAIISRELGIPCIIGTRNATKELQSGERVIMNLQTGEVIKK
ncbi:PEP-utilizing enzyme [Patescibacteria group bacterium]